MAWDDPGKKGSNGNGQDPWGKNGGPPNLDELLAQLQRKIAGLFGGGKGSSFDIQGNGSGKSSLGMWLVIAIVAIAYILSGIYIVQPAEVAVIKRFGAYVRSEQPGPHWIPLLVESKRIINVDEVKTTNHGGQMLTKDENIVDVKIAVQYRIENPKDYLFNVIEPEFTLRQVSESALRSVVGQSTLNEVLTSGRTEVTENIRKQVEQIIASYELGLEVSDLAMQQSKAPDEVKEAFDDAIKAQQDEERFVNQARAYLNERVPVAEGKAKRIIQEATAYKEQQVLLAQGETARFNELLPEYKRAPDILRDRLYLDTLEHVFAKTSKVMVDVEGGNNLMVLPLDQLTKRNPEEVQSVAKLMPSVEELSQYRPTPTESNQRRTRPTYNDLSRPRSQGGNR